MQARLLYGPTVTIRATLAGAVSRNTVVTIGTSPGTGFAAVAMEDVEANVEGAYCVEGTFEVDKITELLYTVGQTVFWNATADPAGGAAETGAATANPEDFPLGIAVDPLTEDGDKVVVKLQQPMIPSA